MHLRLKRKRKFNTLLALQLLLIGEFFLVFLILGFLGIPIAHIFLSPIFGGLYFIFLRLIFHHITFPWIVLLSIISVILVDYWLLPLFFSFSISEIQNFWSKFTLIFLIAGLETVVEEELEVIENKIENKNK